MVHIPNAKAPVCPWCEQPPVVQIAPTQALCGTEKCGVLMWDPSKTPAENFANATGLKTPGIIDGEPPPT